MLRISLDYARIWPDSARFSLISDRQGKVLRDSRDRFAGVIEIRIMAVDR